MHLVVSALIRDVLVDVIFGSISNPFIGAVPLLEVLGQRYGILVAYSAS